MSGSSHEGLVLYKTAPLDPKCPGLPRLLGAGVPPPWTEDFLRDVLSVYKPV